MLFIKDLVQEYGKLDCPNGTNLSYSRSVLLLSVTILQLMQFWTGSLSVADLCLLALSSSQCQIAGAEHLAHISATDFKCLLSLFAEFVVVVLS